MISDSLFQLITLASGNYYWNHLMLKINIILCYIYVKFCLPLLCAETR
jgi:hypothetical protein